MSLLILLNKDTVSFLLMIAAWAPKEAASDDVASPPEAKAKSG